MAGIVALGAAYVLSQFFRVFLAVLSPRLAVELDLDATALGWASAAWFIAFALMQIPLGVALDRLGPRRTAGWLTIAGGAGGALLFASAEGAAGVIAGMALIGAGCSPALMASLYIFARSFPPARFAALGSILIGVGTLGNAGAAAPLSLAADAFGWRVALIAIAAAAAMVGAALLALIRDPAPLPRDPSDRGFGDYIGLLAMPHLWPIYLMMVVNYAPAIGVRGLWAGPYLTDVFGMDGAAVGLATLWMALAMSAGSFFYAPLDRLLGTRKWVVAGGTAAVSALCAALWAFPAASAFWAIAALVAIGFAGTSFGVMMGHARPFFPPAQVGRGVTLMNFFCMAGVGLLQAASGATVDAAPDAASGYAAVFGLYATATAAGTAVYLFSRDSRG
jgi:predicted MFS family arabinose efflux permease